MGDSDDEYDRKRRDKFRGERPESYSREGRRDDRRRDEWVDREWSSRSRARPDYREYRGGGGGGGVGGGGGGAGGGGNSNRERYSPGRSSDMPPPMKRMRSDWDDRPSRYPHSDYYPGGANSWTPEHYPPAHHGNHYPNHANSNNSSNNREVAGNFSNSNIETQPPMMTFKAFLGTQEDTITDEEAIKRYNEYKLEFKRQQLNEFFVAHKDEEWFKIKYHPEESVKRREEQIEALKKRVQVFIDLLNSGKVDAVSIDADQAEPILHLLDSMVIKLEGGTEEDLKILSNPKSIAPLIKEVKEINSSVVEKKVEKSENQDSENTVEDLIKKEKKGKDDENVNDESNDVKDASKVEDDNKKKFKKKKKKKSKKDDDDDEENDAEEESAKSSEKTMEVDNDEKVVEANEKDNENENMVSDTIGSPEKPDDTESVKKKDDDEEDEDDEDESEKKEEKEIEKEKETEAEESELKEEKNEVESIEVNNENEDDEEKSKEEEKSSKHKNADKLINPKKRKRTASNSSSSSSSSSSSKSSSSSSSSSNNSLSDNENEKSEKSTSKRASGDEKNEADGKEKEKDSEGDKKRETSPEAVIDLSEDKEKETVAQPRTLHKTSSIFLRNLAPTITKAEVEAMCKRFSGFLRVAIADPQPERRWFRRGWVSFERQVNIKEICWSLNNIRLRDCELGAIVNRDLLRRIRTVNGITSHKQIVRHDIKLSAKIIHNLDAKAGLWSNKKKEAETGIVALTNTDNKNNSMELELAVFGLSSKNPVLKNITDYLIEEASAEEEELLGLSGDHEEGQLGDGEGPVERDPTLLKVLDRLILYLRIVHSVDYYSHCEYPNEDEMPNRCGIMHVRGPPPAAKISSSEIQDYCRNFENKMSAFLTPSSTVTADDFEKLGAKNSEAEVEKFVQANTQELAKDKWLCPLSGKKFKGPDFIRKHIFNKHGEKVAEVKAEAEYFNNYLKDPKRPMLPEHPGNKAPVKETPRENFPPYGAMPGFRPKFDLHQERFGGGFGGGGYTVSRGIFGSGGGGGGGGGGGYGGSNFSGGFGMPRSNRGGFNRGRGGSVDFRPVIHYRDLDAPREPDEFL